jgi:hypothetical protein
MEGAAETRAGVEPPAQGVGSQTRATAATQSNLVDEAARVAATLNDKLPTLSQEPPRTSGKGRGAPEEAHQPQAHDAGKEAFDAQVLPTPLEPETRAAAEASAERGGGEAVAAGASAAQADTRGGRMRQRAASVGASMGENLRPRVEKLREASTVVFDEASDDPGLRFVIIAALLFLLFLFILLFSYILG